MAEQPTEGLVPLFEALRNGEEGAEQRLFDLVYDELRRIAHGRRIRARAGQTYQTTALVNEAYLRLAGKDRRKSWNDRKHFLRAAALAMRHILVDRARRAAAERHGGGKVRVTMDDRIAAEEAPVDLVALDDALERLAERSRRLAEVVHYRFFLGMTVGETAEALDVSPRTVDSDWHLAKTWLRREMTRGFPVDGGGPDGS
jgi:RNA polymerase sigma factor (TIGR02999 family)